MSDAKKCDRCGQLYEYYHNKDNSVFSAKKSQIPDIHDGSFLSTHCFDLCPECMEDFKKFLRNEDVKKR